MSTKPRTLHCLDVENLVGSHHCTPGAVHRVAQAYLTAVPVDAADHVVLGCSHHNAAAVFFTWPGAARRVLGSGPDGADLALLEVLTGEAVAERFDAVVLGSGDGIFAGAVERLRRQGASVRVVTGRGRLSWRLRVLLTPTVLRLDDVALAA